MSLQETYKSLSTIVRLGIACSFLWALVAGMHDYNSTTKKAEDFVATSYNICLETSHNDFSGCGKQKLNDYKVWTENRTENAIVIALLPLPFFWLYGFIFVRTYKIFRAGFSSEIKYGTLNTKAKTIVVFCIMVVSLTILMGILHIGNMYTDSKVPVRLSPFVDVEGYPLDLAKMSSLTLAGTWEVKNDLGDLIDAYPIQASTINCYKDKMECWESRAIANDGSMTTQLFSYEIKKWTNTEVIFEDYNLCGNIVYSVNLVTKKVAGITQKTNEVQPCGPSNEFKAGHYELVNGYKVYWREHQKARPWFVRTIQGLFGNN